jgi:dTDP-4-dehydrorhamnose reductase
MHKLLLTGSSGFLGMHFYNLLHNQYNIEGIYHNTKNNVVVQNHQVNITDAIALNAVVAKTQPQIIMHTAAISSIALCQQNEAHSYAVNVTASIQLASIAKQLAAQFVFCSTDLVFDGTKGNYTETDTPNPINIYAEQKYIAEQKIMEAYPNAIIARLPLMIGPNQNGTAGVVAEMQQCNAQHKTIHLFTNEYRSPALVSDVVNGLHLLLQNNCSGIYHLGGSQTLNRLQIAAYVKKKYNLQNIELIATTHQQKNITNRPANVSMCISKMKKFGYAPSNLL